MIPEQPVRSTLTRRQMVAMSEEIAASTLYIVATPIGNLADMTYRAVEILSGTDLVACEDTRRTRVLFAHYGIDTPLIALHEHNEDSMSSRLLDKLLRGKSVALVSDAGTPLLSDPGYRLLNRAVDAGVTIRAIPGPSAVTAALCVSGMATDRFSFEGFLPARPSARKTCLRGLREERRTLVFFESSHRIVAAGSSVRCLR